MNADPTRPNVLHVEDDDLDIRAIARAFKKHNLDNPIFVARDGVEALALLRGAGGLEPIPKPYVILLDLRMPKMDGLQFLEVLRADPELSDSVVFVVTTSDRDDDVCQSYQYNVAGYILKSDLSRPDVSAVRMLESYLDCVELPN